MSGIDEIGMESCSNCLSQHYEDISRQYWSIRNRTHNVLGYYNPDEFRACRNGRMDKINPVAGSRKRIAANPILFVDSIDSFICEICGKRITKEHPDFGMMKTLVFDFVSGDVFSKLRR